MGIVLYVLAVFGICVGLLLFCLSCWYFLYAKPMAAYYTKRKQELAYPEPKIIVVGSGPPKRSFVDILAHPGPMPEWKKVEDHDKTRRK